MGNINNKIEPKLDIKILQKGGDDGAKWRVWSFYATLLTELSKYLTMTDENIKMQYYINPQSRNIFNNFTINIEIIKHLMGNTYNGWWWLHFNGIPRGWELFTDIMMGRMGWVWNPLERPTMKLAIEHGLLTFDLLYKILENESKAIRYINIRIQEKNNAPSVAAQNVRNSRKQIEIQLQGEANRLNNVLYQKEQEKNNAGKILTTTRNNYQNALNDYNKRLNDLKKIQ